MNTRSSVIRAALSLGMFATLTALILGTTNFYTQPRIEHQVALAERRSFDEVLPPTFYNNDLINDVVERPAWLQRVSLSDKPIHIARTNGNATAMVFRLDTLQGYSGRISLIAAISTELEVIGVRVISHQETPGLGDKIEVRKNPWILSFNEQTYSEDEIARWDVKKYQGDFDQFTGATITPRAIVILLRDTLSELSNHPEWVEGLNNE